MYPRERPLQRSMFLIQNNQPPQNNARVDIVHFNPIKRSSTPMIQQVHHSMPQNQQYFVQPMHQNIYQGNIVRQTSIGSSNSYREQQRQLTGRQMAQNTVKYKNQSQTSVFTLLPIIFEQLKQKYMNNWLKVFRQQVFVDLSNIKRDLIQIKKQMKQHIEKQQIINRQIKLTTNIINFNNSSINQINGPKQEDINAINNKIHNIQNKIKIIQSQNDKKQKYNNKIDLFQKQIQNISNKINKFSEKIVLNDIKDKIKLIKQIKPVQLSLKQSFILKTSTQTKQLIINQNKYFIDNQGYLMDHKQTYLLDENNKQIKLQSFHLDLLQNNKILQLIQ